MENLCIANCLVAFHPPILRLWPNPWHCYASLQSAYFAIYLMLGWQVHIKWILNLVQNTVLSTDWNARRLKIAKPWHAVMRYGSFDWHLVSHKCYSNFNYEIQFDFIDCIAFIYTNICGEQQPYCGSAFTSSSMQNWRAWLINAIPQINLLQK